MARGFHNEDIWRRFGFESLPSRRTLSRFITDFKLVVEEVFIDISITSTFRASRLKSS